MYIFAILFTKIVHYHIVFSRKRYFGIFLDIQNMGHKQVSLHLYKWKSMMFLYINGDIIEGILPWYVVYKVLLVQVTMWLSEPFSMFSRKLFPWLRGRTSESPSLKGYPQHNMNISMNVVNMLLDSHWVTILL